MGIGQLLVSLSSSLCSSTTIDISPFDLSPSFLRRGVLNGDRSTVDRLKENRTGGRVDS